MPCCRMLERGCKMRQQSSDWAKTYVQKAISAELMNGVGNGIFAPQENALREQAIVVIYRMKIKKQ